MFTISEIFNFISIAICSNYYQNYYVSLLFSIIAILAYLIGLILSKKY